MNKSSGTAHPRHICEMCGQQAGGFDFPPSLGGKTDGVYCHSRKLAEQNECLEEYEQTGTALLWRIEVLVDDADCSEWVPKTPPQPAGH